MPTDLSDTELRALISRVVRRTLGVPESTPAAGSSASPVAGASTAPPTTAGSSASPVAGAFTAPPTAAAATAPVAGAFMAPPPSPIVTAPAAPPASVLLTVALGADHGGYALKESLKEFLTSLGHPVIDCGTHSTDPVDYPDLAFAVARLVSAGQAARGILVDGAGIGSAMAANKVPGVRAALCYDHATAVNSREHNDANVLTLGAGLIGPALARQIVQTWLATPFGGGRHQRRVDKINLIEQRFLKNGA